MLIHAKFISTVNTIREQTERKKKKNIKTPKQVKSSTLHIKGVKLNILSANFAHLIFTEGLTNWKLVEWVLVVDNA